ncbi:MAG: XdhC family protein [Xanthomonadales bacterium]|nr:XdhC family protein [Xanthomonadales bacterium]
MDEGLIAQLALALEADRPVVLASVLETHGSTPRQRGARMLIEADRIHASVGGGAMEAQVVAAARSMLALSTDVEELQIALDGRRGSAGVCGGGMRLALRRWHGATMAKRARALADALAQGKSAHLNADELGTDTSEARTLVPRSRLLIVGAGHCGHALAQLAQWLDFEVLVADSRAECFAPGRFGQAQCLDGSADSLHDACATPRALFIVLLSRDYPTDVATLDTLAGTPCAFIGMMGSQRRVQQVRQALPQHAAWLESLIAPIGLEIGHQTPHEIAVSILAQLIARRRRALASG